MTGYTHKVIQGQSFEDFVKTCARNFGALVTLRDEPLGPDIPTFDPSDYNNRALAKAQETKQEWDAMTDERREQWASQERERLIASCKESHAKLTRENEQIDAMLDRVQAWTPPTLKHSGLKSFMIEQLTISLNDLSHYDVSKFDGHDYSDLALANERTRKIAWEIDYHTRGQASEIERTKGKNDWVKALVDSLIDPEDQRP